MTEQELNQQITEIMRDYEPIRARLVAAVNAYVEANPLRCGYYYSLQTTERLLDSLALDRAWIEDRINDGVTSYRPRRRSNKIAKALGYISYERRR